MRKTMAGSMANIFADTGKCIAKLKFTHVNEIKLCQNSYIVYENDCVHKELKFDVCMPTDTCHLKTINHIKHRF